MEGTEYYILSVTQAGAKITAEVSVDQTALTEYKGSLESDETFEVPTELFFWMSPTFGDGHDFGSMYPAARKTITTGDLFDADGNAVEGGVVSVEIDIEALARDWNIGWIDIWKFDEPGTEYSDDMNGFYLFMSDGYKRYDNEYWDDGYYEDDSYEDDYYYMRGLAIPEEGYDFTFYNSRPAGSGYSNVADHTGEAYDTISLSQAGLYVASDRALGGEPFKVTLVLEDDQSWNSGSDSIHMDSWHNGSFVLDETNWSTDDSTDTTKVWYLVFDPAYSTPMRIDQDYCLFITKDQDLNLWYSSGWQSSRFHYVGFPVSHQSTDFDGGGTLDGRFSSEGGDLVKTTEEYNYYPIYGTPDNAYNNWKIGIPYPEHRYEGADEYNKVLGLSWGSEVSEYYHWYRYDVVAFPGVNLPNDTEVRVSFKVRYDFDYGDDYVELQMQDSGGWWNEIGWFIGKMDWERQRENNGWWTYISEPFWTNVTENPQAVRFIFYSNDYEESTGIMIDDFKIMELQ